MHATPASSLCAQLCVPQGRCRQSKSSRSLPEHRTSSRVIDALLDPKCALKGEGERGEEVKPSIRSRRRRRRKRRGRGGEEEEVVVVVVVVEGEERKGEEGRERGRRKRERGKGRRERGRRRRERWSW